jgi:hypothetical protein
MDHFNSRINNDISMKTWFLGMEQMFNSLSISPLFGHGVGSTGYFIVDYYGLQENNINLYDGYSMFFRLVIEYGILPTSYIIYLIIEQLYHFKNYLCAQGKSYKLFDMYFVFIFIFSFTIIVGSLLKEPAYGRSSLFIAIFLFSYSREFLKNSYVKL